MLYENLTEFNQSDRCAHFSCPERSVSPAVYVLLYVCSAAVVLITVCGNLLVIISVCHFKQLHTPTNMFVVCLAMSDFLFGMFLMPPIFIWTIESCWIFGRVFCNIYWVMIGLLSISTYTIAQIAVDRYLALSNPFLYMNIVSVRFTCFVIAVNWSVAVVYNLAFFFSNENYKTFVMCPGECVLFSNDMWIAIDLIYFFVFPLSVIIIFYTLVFVIAKKHATAIRELNNHTQPKTHKITSHSMKSESKAAKVLGILVFVFLSCLLPYYICSLLGSFVVIQAETIRKVMIIGCVNWTINPFIYALFYPWFKRCTKLIISLQIFQTDSSLIKVLS